MNFYSIKEASEILKISDTTLYRYVKEGKIPAVKLGRQYRISDETLGAFAAGHGGDPIPAPAGVKPSRDIEFNAGAPTEEPQEQPQEQPQG